MSMGFPTLNPTVQRDWSAACSTPQSSTYKRSTPVAVDVSAGAAATASRSTGLPEHAIPKQAAITAAAIWQNALTAFRCAPTRFIDVPPLLIKALGQAPSRHVHHESVRIRE